jgi:8-oxo-dGTP pyrophosphatase MutT (NUDIX family)
MQESARGVLLTSTGLVLLMRIRGSLQDVWITPGGRIRPGESPFEAAIREIREETGLQALTVEREIWIRHGTYLAGGQRLPERERFFLVPTEEFQPTTSAMEPEELSRHRGYRWWSISELARSRELFVPRRLAELLRDLEQFGPPTSPVESGE